ncbi:gluconate 2-dehydrogenase subunit 3 family protein [Halosimplex sp. TS25]|uniref:gluconate 2-dehydrogenase subunit 3 family protein n=1 Tax=Halosimplex rarum TaxID=3396619 RepID=UPI0039E93F0E
MTDSNSAKLSRRDALAALAAVGVAGGGALALSAADGDDGDGDDAETAENGQDGGDAPPYGAITADDLTVLTAVAETVYPSEVEGVDSFVTAFVRGRASAQPDHAAGIADAVGYLSEWTGAWYEESFASLDPAGREEALDRMGVREADPDPDGSDAARVRYYVVNELLFALYSSPTGAELVGIENPQGHPGGTESYRRGPD